MNNFLTIVKSFLDGDYMLNNYLKIFIDRKYHMVYVVYRDFTLKIWVFNTNMINGSSYGSMSCVQNSHFTKVIDEIEKEIKKHG